MPEQYLIYEGFYADRTSIFLTPNQSLAIEIAITRGTCIEVWLTEESNVTIELLDEEDKPKFTAETLKAYLIDILGGR